MLLTRLKRMQKHSLTDFSAKNPTPAWNDPEGWEADEWIY
nr:MAG TPA: hypothetical protein [Caudoviricetes sp.]